MRLHKRLEIVRAMDMLARSINDEDIVEAWLINGVADGDIESDTQDEDLEFYADDETFGELMAEFTRLMGIAYKNGGLYVDKVCSDDYR